MKFNINKDTLVEILQKVLGPTTTKQNFPILNSILITAQDGKLKFTTTDLDITIISSISAQITKEGSFTVPMKRFFSIIRELPSADITIELQKNNLLIKCENIEFKITTLNSEEFPKIEEEKKVSLIKVNSESLEEMIRMTSFCMGSEEANYVLSGILFEIEEDYIKLIGTDGKRMAFIKKKLSASQPEIKKKISFILPGKAINEVYKLLKDKDQEIFLFIGTNKVGFDFKETQFISRPIEGDFPNYFQYIPSEGKDKLKVDREKILLALKRADLLSTQDYQAVKVEIKKDSVIISKSTPQLGEAKEVIDGEYNGQAFQIGFNPAYLTDVLRNISDVNVVFEFFGPEKPAVIRKDDYIYLVLPMKF